ncbi:DUF7666 domain-containing protein, partial [Microvirga alba]|nr:hypothetical protein [Microvirga alba]
MAKKPAPKPTPEVITAFKGFDKNLACRSFQYEIGKTYKSDSANIVRCAAGGFHSCDNPLDIWSYYPVLADDGSLARYAVVEASGKICRAEANDTKFASGEITIKAELKLPEFIKAAVSWMMNNVKADGEASSGHYARLASSGDSAQLASSGHYARLASSGGYAQLASSGDYAQLASSG